MKERKARKAAKRGGGVELESSTSGGVALLEDPTPRQRQQPVGKKRAKKKGIAAAGALGAAGVAGAASGDIRDAIDDDDDGLLGDASPDQT